jgi:serine/threonine protein kinase
MGCCASADDKLLAGSSSKTPEIPSGFRQSDSKGLSSAWDFVGDEKLGSGAFGDVYLIKNRDTGRLAAVKVQKKSGMQEEDKLAVLEEVRIMKLLKHRNIVQFIDFFDEEDNMYVVIEYLAGGTMFDRVVKKDHYNEKEARDLIYIFLKAVQHCHDRNVIHRDIKPENMLMVSESDDADVKLADFGLSILLEEGQMCDTPCGTPCYVSPEMISQPVKYSKPADMWAVGCIAFILLGGYPPFTFDDESRSSMVKM